MKILESNSSLRQLELGFLDIRMSCRAQIQVPFLDKHFTCRIFMGKLLHVSETQLLSCTEEAKVPPLGDLGVIA